MCAPRLRSSLALADAGAAGGNPDGAGAAGDYPDAAGDDHIDFEMEAAEDVEDANFEALEVIDGDTCSEVCAFCAAENGVPIDPTDPTGQRKVSVRSVRCHLHGLVHAFFFSYWKWQEPHDHSFVAHDVSSLAISVAPRQCCS